MILFHFDFISFRFLYSQNFCLSDIFNYQLRCCSICYSNPSTFQYRRGFSFFKVILYIVLGCSSFSYFPSAVHAYRIRTPPRILPLLSTPSQFLFSLFTPKAECHILSIDVSASHIGSAASSGFSFYLFATYPRLSPAFSHHSLNN